MKKTLTLMILIFAIFTISQDVNAASTCTVEGGRPVNAGDPACYTSTTTNCSWGSGYAESYMWDGRMITSTFYNNTCGKPRHCSNHGALPDAGTKTTNTCYYLTVDTWSDCDENGIQSATNITQNSVGGSECDNLNDARTRNCGICDSTVSGVATGIAPGTPPQTKADLCTYTDTDPVPFPAELNGNMWEWKCFGDSNTTTQNTTVMVEGNAVTSYSDDVTCSAPREEKAECNTVFSDANPLLTIAPTESDDLCSGGTYEAGSLTGASSDGPWSWNCLRIGNNSDHDPSITCNAECFRPELIINPDPFPWPMDGSDATVDISIEPEGMCGSRYTCETDDSNEIVPFSGSEPLKIDITQNPSSLDIPVTCTSSNPIIDDPKTTTETISGYCTAKECNAQGSCQSTPISSDSANAVTCTSSCNSNADCSSGRLIETQP